MSRLPKLHARRVAKEALAYEAEVAILRAAHDAECDMIQKLNDDIQRSGTVKECAAYMTCRFGNQSCCCLQHISIKRVV